MKLDNQDLAQLAQIIHRLYGEIRAQDRKIEGRDTALLGAILQTVKLALGNRGGYEKYIQEYCGFSPRTARRLMRQGDAWLQAKLLSNGVKAEIQRLKAKDKEERAEIRRSMEQFAKENPYTKSLWPFRD